MSSAVILEQNWKSEQVRPGHSPGWLYGAGLVTRREAEVGAGLSRLFLRTVRAFWK